MLDEIQGVVDQLFNDIKSASDISPLLRSILLDLAETMRRAIAEYEIRGVKGLRKSILLMIGHLHAQRSELAKADRSVKAALYAVWEISTKHFRLPRI